MKTSIYNFTKNYNNDIIHRLANRLKNGSVGIFPTDTVYGIACNAFNETSINKLFKLKSRDHSKPINVLISSLNMLDYLVENITIQEKKLIDTFWPGPLTIIFNKKPTVSNILTSNLNTVGIRMPNDKIALSLIKNSNVPLATTSVNISGHPPGTNINDFLHYFNDKVDFIIDNGETNIKHASTVVQIINKKPIILRQGSISEEEIYKTLNLI